MGRCAICERKSKEIAAEIGVCRSCILNKPDQALPPALEAHRRSRASFGLPETGPRDPEGIPCRLCVHAFRWNNRDPVEKKTQKGVSKIVMQAKPIPEQLQNLLKYAVGTQLRRTICGGIATLQPSFG